jgi:hypothetical protein
LFEVAPWFVRRFPVLSRSLRGVARWRIYRWLFVIAMTAAASGLLRVQPASVRTTALAGVALWLLGLAVCESFAQEHDRADRLAGLPMALGVELRQIGSCWLLLVAMLLPACAIALAGRSNLTTVIALAAASASGATAGACNSLRRVWKSFDVRYANNPALVAGPFVGGDIALTLAWPVLLVILCIAPWARQSHGVGLLLSSVVVFGGFVFWIKTGGIHAFGHRLFPRLVSPPQ